MIREVYSSLEYTSGILTAVAGSDSSGNKRGGIRLVRASNPVQDFAADFSASQEFFGAYILWAGTVPTLQEVARLNPEDASGDTLSAIVIREHGRDPLDGVHNGQPVLQGNPDVAMLTHQKAIAIYGNGQTPAKPFICKNPGGIGEQLNMPAMNQMEGTGGQGVVQRHVVLGESELLERLINH